MPDSKIQPSTINIILRLFGRIKNQAYFAVENENEKNRIKDNFGQGESGLYSALSIQNNGHGYAEPIPPYAGRHYPVQQGWQDLIIEEIAQFNNSGAAYITRVSECIIKTFGLINIHQGENNRELALFRGQHNAEWDIISSIGRSISPEEELENISSVSEQELISLRKWQELVETSSILSQEIFNGKAPYDKDDPRWWAIKQHYEGGTRLIDWTSSPLCALYFSCVDWDGVIHSNFDGGLYASMKGLGRRFVHKDTYDTLSDFHKDVYDCAGSTLEDYFNLNKHPEYTRTVVGEPDSDRQLAQDGHFMFHPRFNKSFEQWDGATPFFFVIPKEYKLSIMRELYSIGYTPEKIVRGQKGVDAHKKLKEQLGIDV